MRRMHLGAAFLAAVCFAGAALAETVEIQMTTVDFEPTFVPSSVTVHPGDMVRWVNVDPFLLEHSTVSGTGSADPTAGELWNSGTLSIGQYFEFTFDEIGTFEYFSVPHEFEGMFGVIHVSNSTGAPEPDDPEVLTSTWGNIKKTFSSLLPKD
jgi:plastocyanin